MKDVTKALCLITALLACSGCEQSSMVDENGGGSTSFTWTEVNTGLTNPLVNGLVVSGSNLFAGTYGGGVFRSSDNGESWAEAGLTTTAVHSMAVAPDGNGGTVVLAGVALSGAYRSTDNGASWTQSSTGMVGPNNIWSFAVGDAETFAAGTRVYRSTNSGASWTPVGLTNMGAHTLALSGTNLFAGASGSTGIFQSTNSGGIWTPASSGLPGSTVECLAIKDSTIFAGIFLNGAFRSTNSGESWTAASGFPNNTSVNAIAVTGSRLFAATAGGVFLSTDNGENWTAVNDGLQSNGLSVGVGCFAVSADGTYLFAGGNSGVFRAELNP